MTRQTSFFSFAFGFLLAFSPSLIFGQNPAQLGEEIPLANIANDDQLLIDLGKKLGQGLPLNPDFKLGLYFDPDHLQIYPLVFSPEREVEEIAILEPKGILKDNAESLEYPWQVGAKGKYAPRLMFSQTASAWQGRLNLPCNISEKSATITWAGTLEAREPGGFIKGNVGLRLAIPALGSKAWKEVALYARLKSAWLVTSHLEKNGNREQVNQLYRESERDDKKTAELNALLGEIPLGKEGAGYFKDFFPDEIVLAGLKPEYNSNTHEFFCSGKVDWVAAAGTDIRREVGIYMNYALGDLDSMGVRGSDVLDLYLEIDDLSWFYFKITPYTVGAFSSDENGFNASLHPGGKNPYVQLLSEEEKDEFLKDFVTRHIFKD
ncbi:MAG: hypothetical protein H6581_23280 [Bacteroidia bacterium]|nr:hypothetical protein [Bacteroidia bacterium]